MKAKKNSIELMQWIVSALTPAMNLHRVQSRIFEKQGYVKIAKKLTESADEEQMWIDTFVDRLIDIGGDIKLNYEQNTEVCMNVMEYLEKEAEDSAVSIDAFYDRVNADDYDGVTYLKIMSYLEDEEADAVWFKAQIELAEAVGKENYLASLR